MSGQITRMCLGRCGRRVAPTAPNGRCPQCAAAYRPGGHWSTGRDRAAQAAFRAALVKRARTPAAPRGRCEAMQAGVRCSATERLQAHHIDPQLGDSLSNGALLCPVHHAMLDPHARG